MPTVILSNRMVPYVSSSYYYYYFQFIEKYREVKPKEYLVADCRGPKERSVKIDEARCTMYFADDLHFMCVQDAKSKGNHNFPTLIKKIEQATFP